MKKIFQLFIYAFLFHNCANRAGNNLSCTCTTQDTFFITHGTYMLAMARLYNDGTIKVTMVKLKELAPMLHLPQAAKVIDAKGKQVYPGLISSQY